MNCTTCGAPIQAGHSTCSFCGTGLGGAVAGVPPTTFTVSALPSVHTKRRDGHVSRTTTVTLLPDRIVFGAGTPTELPLSQITSVREEETFNGERFVGYPWLVIVAGTEIGLMLKPADHQAWLSSLAAFTRR